MRQTIAIVLAAICGVSVVRAQAPIAVWHNNDLARSFDPDSVGCMKVARQLSGVPAVKLHRAEFVGCMKGEGWQEAWRYVGRDSCVPIVVSWVKPPDLPATVLDSLRRELETAIAARFFPVRTLGDLEARVAFGPAVAGYTSTSTRIVTATAARRMNKDEQYHAAEEPVGFALAEFPSVQDTHGNFVELSGVAVLHARCLRDLAVEEFP